MLSARHRRQDEKSRERHGREIEANQHWQVLSGDVIKVDYRDNVIPMGT